MSQVYQKKLENALEMLQREDPSLKVKFNEDTGQTIVSGMGELHLEIVLERIRSEYGVEASLGAFQVAYKETVVNEITDVFILDKTLGNKKCNFLIIDSDRLTCEIFSSKGGTKQFVKMSMSIKPNSNAQGAIPLEKGTSKESRDQLSTVWAIHMKAAERGVASALSSGPLLSFPVIMFSIL